MTTSRRSHSRRTFALTAAISAASALASGCGNPPDMGDGSGKDLTITGPGRHDATGDTSFIAAVQLTSPENHLVNNQRCSGALIGADYVLTGAHCLSLEPESTPGASQTTNSSDRCSTNDSPGRTIGPSAHWTFTVRLSNNRVTGGELVAVTTATPNPTFDWSVSSPPNPVADIAVLKLAHPVSATPIRLADADDSPAGTPVTLYGWGHQPACTSSAPLMVQQLDTQILPTQQCEDGLSQFELCAATVQTATDRQGQCTGDSGGPLVMRTSAGPVIAGVASRSGKVCGDGPDIYTSVSDFRSWIDSVIHWQ